MKPPDPTIDAFDSPDDRDPSPSVDRQSDIDPKSGDDEIARILDEYLLAVERGDAESREAFLAGHPKHAERLGALLDGVALFEQGETLGLATTNDPGMPDSIGDYEILGELGRGGMGVVYEAREKSLDRIVALKVMRFGIVDPKALERFQREAETAGALHHTNIVPVYATGRQGDTSWYAMQRIEGPSLAQRIAKSREANQFIDLEEILHVGIQSAEALQHAHQRHVIHRDVKPANLIIDLEDRVWLTDFGLARRLLDVGATMTGAMLGTPRYMSPEQADLTTTEVDHRSDIYSLGASLYELATLRPPFDGDDPLKLITHIRYDEPPPPRSIRPDLPRDLEVVLEKCMSKEASRRYDSAGDLAEDLRAIADDRPIKARAVSVIERAARWTRKHHARIRVAAATVVATAITIALTAFAANRYRESTLGSFRLRAADGPYMTTVYPLGQTSLSSSAIQLTVPMQTPRKLTAGDYEMMLAPEGRWSRKLRLPIVVGESSEYRLSSESLESNEQSFKEHSSKEAELQDSFVVAVAGSREPAILSRHDGVLSRTTHSGKNAWQLDVSDVETPVTRIDKGGVHSEAGTENVDFSVWKPNLNFHHGHRSLDDQPVFASGQLALQTPIDLNGDSRSDTLIAATDRSALMAIDDSGEVIWKHSFQIDGLPSANEIPDPHAAGKTLAVPAILQMIDAGDLNGDQISDVAALMVHIEIGKPIQACIVAVSGKTGEPLHSILPPAIQVVKGFWPSDGLIRFGRYRSRDFSSLGFSSQRVYRSSGHQSDRFVAQFQPRSSPVQIPVPSPIQLIHGDDTSVTVIYQSGNECRRYDLRTGEEMGATIQLGFMPATTPVIARHGDELLLGFTEIQERWQNATGKLGTRFAVHRLDAMPAWSRLMERVEWFDSVARTPPDWPLVTDLDSDGRCEFLLPHSKYINGVELGMSLVDSLTGASIWPSDLPRQLVGSAESCISRIAVTDDIDADGWDDLAIASIAGPGNPEASMKRSTDSGEAYVYIDWISGKTGLPISWARHRIPVFSNRIHVADIDAIRSRLPGSPLGSVEIDFVTGDTTIDAELSSMVLRFHPGSPDPVAVAAGLDVIETPKTDSSIRVFRRRSGPYRSGVDRLTLIPDSPSSPFRLGEQNLIASWTNGDGHPRIAATDERQNRVSVIDGDSFQTLWSEGQETVVPYEWKPVDQKDGSIDFLRTARSNEDQPPTLIDGETGKARWTMSENSGGKPIVAHYIDQGRSLMVVGHGRVNEDVNGVKHPNSFKLSVVNAASGFVRWSRYFLFEAPRYNYPNGFDDLQWIDVNGDGREDLIGPMQTEDDKTLLLAAMDGQTGEILWSKSANRHGAQTDYFVLFRLLRVAGTAHVIFLTADDENIESNLLVLCHAGTGQRVATHRIENSSFLKNVDRTRVHHHISLADCSTSPDHTRIALQISVGNRYESTVLQLDDGRWETSSKIQNDPQRFTVHGTLLRDIDGDQIPERLVLEIPKQSLQTQSYQSSAAQSYRLRCYPLQESQPSWEVTIPETQYVDRFQWIGSPSSSLLVLRLYRRRIYVIDCRQGKILLDEPESSSQRDAVPILPVSNGSAGVIRTAVATTDGIEFRSSGTAGSSTTSPSRHTVDDPRRVMSLVSGARNPHALSNMLASTFRGFAATTALLVLPLGYVFATARRRRWSLSWLMVAPLVVSVWFLFWNLSWIHDPGLGVNFVWGIPPLAFVGTVYLAMRERKHPNAQLNTRLYLIVGTLAMFVLLLGFEYARAVDPMIRYTLGFNDLVFVAMTAVGLVSILYWILRFPVDLGHLLRKRFGFGART